MTPLERMNGRRASSSLLSLSLSSTGQTAAEAVFFRYFVMSFGRSEDDSLRRRYTKHIAYALQKKKKKVNRSLRPP